MIVVLFCAPAAIFASSHPMSPAGSTSVSPAGTMQVSPAGTAPISPVARPGISPVGPAPRAVLSGIPNPLRGVSSIGELFYKLADFLISLSYVVIAFFLILSGFKFVKAQGNETELEEAKKTFYYTIIGALILIGANTIIAIVKNLMTSLNT